MIQAVGFAAKHSFSNLKRFEFERASALANEVEMDVLYCPDRQPGRHPRGDWFVRQAQHRAGDRVVEKGNVRFRYVINMASLKAVD